MLPTRLNFLPKEKQKYLHHAVISSVITSIMETLLLCVCICTTALLFGYLFIEKYFQDVATNTISIDQQHTEQVQTIRQANTLIQNTYAIETQTPLLTPMIQQITESIPSGVSIDRMTLDVTKKELFLSGVAQTRENYLSLESALKQISFLDTVVIPLSDLTQKNNIAFSFSVDLR